MSTTPSSDDIPPPLESPDLQPEVTSFLEHIFDVLLLSDAALPVLHGYFRRAHNVSRAKTALRRLLRLDDNGTAAYLQPYGTLNSADKHILKAFRQWYQRHAIPDDFDWSTFSDAIFEHGPSPSTAPPFSEPDLPDAADFLRADSSPVASVTTTAPSPPPGKMAHSYFDEIQALASANRMKFDHQLPFGSDLKAHPDWQVSATTKLLIDTSGFQQATIPTLRTSRRIDIIQWYNQYQQIAYQFGIHVIPYSLFRVDCVCYPCTIPPAQVDAMNRAQLVRFGSADVFNLSDPTIKLHREHHLLHHGQDTLCVYNFLHCLLSSTINATETFTLPVPPRLADSPDVTTFASHMMTFMHQHGIMHHYSARSATLHFLDELAQAGHDIERERTNVLGCDPTIDLPPHLHLNAVAVRFLSHKPDHAHVALAVTRGQRKSKPAPTLTPPPNNPFKQLAPDAVCHACGRRGHQSTSCIFLARFALLMEFYHEHKTQTKNLATTLTDWHSSSRRQALVNLLQLSHPDADLTSDDDDMLPHVLAFFAQDFPPAGHSQP